MGTCSVEAIWMVMKSHHKTNIMINPHKNNAVFQLEMTYSREDIWMNLWGSFRDSSRADDCIFIQTFCFSLLIICRLEMAMRPVIYKMVCTFPGFFIHTLPIISFESRSRYNLAGNKSLKSLKYLPKGNILHQKNRRERHEELPEQVSGWSRVSVRMWWSHYHSQTALLHRRVVR